MIPDKFERKGEFRFLDTWVFPIPIQDWLKDLMKSLYIHPKSLTHVCCGKSKIGGLKIDIDASLKPDIAADILDLPWILGNNSQAHTLADFPWQISYADRRYFSYALRDITEEGGFVIINSPWNPWVKGLKLIRCYKVFQSFNSYRDLVDFWLFQKATSKENERFYFDNR